MSGSSAYEYNEPDMEAMPYSVHIHNKLRRANYEIPQHATDEIDTYLKEEVASPTTNVLDWWQKNSSIYPTLSLMARDFLAQQTTSVAAKESLAKRWHD
ncbi:uncharacterized protein LOC135922383 [Gordionus sp. m RMFG-2023]|uniref:uncharacterized protein LOC135922383 n=1 Tax=Gordionus sp. m RMFG-2023 TaxID=3053472 RepID=UPI0031FCE62A